MADNVIKSHVFIQVNGSQAVQELNQVNQATAKVGKGFSKTQQISQQLTFAVDDAVTSFGTGGLAGALRGAANNLSMVAMMIGGVKTQLAVIGGIAAFQLIISQFNRMREAAGDAKDAVDRYKHSLEIMTGRTDTDIGQRSQLREIAGLRTTAEGFNRQRSLDNELNDLIAKRGKLVATIRDLSRRITDEQEKQQMLEERGGEASGDDLELVTDRIAAMRESRAERIKELDTIKEEIKQQRELNIAVRDQVELLQQRRLEGFGLLGIGTAGGLARELRIGGAMIKGGEDIGLSGGAGIKNNIGILGGVGKLLREARNREKQVPPTSFFRRLPGAGQMGTVGAASTLNQAKAGSQNVQSAQLNELRSIQRNTARGARAGENLGNKLEVVG